MNTPEQWLKENRPERFVGGRFETRRRSDFTDAEFAQLDDYTASLIVANSAYHPQPTTLEAPTHGFTFDDDLLDLMFESDDPTPYELRVELTEDNEIVLAGDWQAKLGKTYKLEVISITGDQWRKEVQFTFGDFKYCYGWAWGSWSSDTYPIGKPVKVSRT